MLITIISSTVSCEQKLAEAIQIIAKLRKHKKIWDEHYGAQNKNNLQRWEQKADAFLESIVITTKGIDEEPLKTELQSK